MEKENLTRPSLSELFAKTQCQCDGGEQHGHCWDCDKRIQAGKTMCFRCEEENKRHRQCHECEQTFILPLGEPIPQRFVLELCSQECRNSLTLRQLSRSGVPPQYLKCTLDNFNAYTPVLERALQLVREWSGTRQEDGLYLFGPPGAGKTHLAVGAARAPVERGENIGFCNARRLSLRCQSAFSQGQSPLEIVEDELACRLLVLDDLGSEKPTDFVKQTLLHVVDEAYANGKVLVVTSNLSLDNLDRVDSRLPSRLAEMCLAIKVDVPDYRLRIAVERAETIRRSAQSVV